MRVPAILTTLALTPLLQAQAPLTAWEIPEQEAAAETALEFRQLRVPGGDTRQAVAMLARELDWNRTLSSARKEARQSGKPIFWVQALGTLTGYT